MQARAFNTPKVKAIVMGNPSADMDSVVGSIALSWWYGSLAGNAPLKYCPVINCPREDLSMRVDIVHNLNKFGIDDDFVKNNLLFKEDLIGEDAIESVALVDFN